MSIDNSNLATLDPDIFAAMEAEKARQKDHIELIASENFTLPAVMEACGSVLTNKYAEGYPGKRFYSGCEYVDVVEQLAIDRAKALFGADHANVQPHSGSQANFAVYTAVLQPGDQLLTMELSHGGHLTHGNPVNFSGKLYKVAHYGVSLETGRIDYDQLEAQAHAVMPKMITVGASAYPRIIDFERMGRIAKDVGAYLFADMAHIAGLVATGEHPSPVPFADFVTTTTHKTLRGPRGGLILCRAEFAKKIDSAVFPGGQGGPLMHIIAGKAVCFHEAMKPSFKEYAHQVVVNCKAFAQALSARGYGLLSGGTDNHLILIDLRKSHPDLTGKVVQMALEEANLTTNRNTVPGETRSPFQTSGLRLGTAAMTSRGFMPDDFRKTAEAIDMVINNIGNEAKIAEAKQIAIDLCKKYPLPY